ncbi:MAG: DUF4230 domain-containing protein [Anaerolineales bacterium]|nr:DUF4230 domain-containing protein [Anaerolineales bacterium]
MELKNNYISQPMTIIISVILAAFILTIIWFLLAQIPNLQLHLQLKHQSCQPLNHGQKYPRLILPRPYQPPLIFLPLPLPPTPTPTITPTPSPTPKVVDWHELGYLTSIEFTTTTVIKLDKVRDWWPDDTILLLAVGEIQAGIDMTQIKDTNIRIEGNKVKMVLPRATVTGVELIPSETQIIEKRGLFPSDGLEIEALDQARTQLKDWAVTQGNLMDLAEKFAKLQLENFLRQLGFEDVQITFEESKGNL